MSKVLGWIVVIVALIFVAAMLANGADFDLNTKTMGVLG
jgi:hypothetical protein